MVNSNWNPTPKPLVPPKFIKVCPSQNRGDGGGGGSLRVFAILDIISRQCIH